MRLVFVSLTLAPLLFFTGCASVSSFQTARTIKSGTSRFVIGGGYYASTLKNSVGEKIGFPMLEGLYRYGLDKNLDLGFKYTVPGQIGGDIKWQLMDGENFAFATGLGGSYLSFANPSTTSATSETNSRFTFNFIELSVPVYLSYDLSKAFSVYLTPRYVTRFATQGSNQNFIGSNLGLRVGKTSGVFLELSYLKGLAGLADQIQGGIGFYFGGGPVFESEEESNT